MDCCNVGRLSVECLVPALRPLPFVSCRLVALESFELWLADYLESCVTNSGQGNPIASQIVANGAFVMSDAG